MSLTLNELAARFGCAVEGDGDTRVARIATLSAARGDAVAFLANPHYLDQLAATRAAAVILERKHAAAAPVPCLVTDNPYALYARVAAVLHPPADPVPGIHATAAVAPGARVAASAEVGAHVSLGPDSEIGEGAVIGAGTVVGAHSTIGAGTRLAPRVAVLDGVRIGRRCIVHSGAVIGADGFGFAPDAGEWVKVPQLGGVTIGDDVEIGANTTIDRGTIDDTVVEDGVKLDNLIMIGHNVTIGAHTIMVAMAGVAGSTKIGKRCMIGGGAAMVGHLTIGNDVTLLFKSVVTKSVPDSAVIAGTLPADEAPRWRRNAARFKNLDSFVERLRALERRVRGADPTPDRKDTTS